MYKIDKIISIVLFIILIIVSIYFKISFIEKDISNFITFFSIYIGFILTSFSIMSTSEEVKKLRMKFDIENTTLTALHRLAKYFKINLYLSFITLLLLLLTNAFNLYILTNNLLLSLVFVVLYSSKELIKVLFDLFVGKIVET
ncbi:MAG: hypothetical protein IJB79_08705 [Candidatus Gastranaerophilales bacterium]|nr:hypothetical protein [Candidatus Gastranaerophilales bacterium]